MTIKAILSLLFVWLAIYALRQRLYMRIISDIICVVGIGGIIAVWFPQLTTKLAEIVGVGRGADLLLYAFVSISLMVIFVIHLRLRAVDRSLTIIARTIALSNPKVAETSTDITPNGGERSQII